MDHLEGELMSELENARLVRLLAKFGFINERPECVSKPPNIISLIKDHQPCRFARDPRWSETGDRYIIKLFRDYVFHQVDERGRPVVSLSHVLSCLNKVCYIFSFPGLIV
jgi:PAB-dependent poly(A)-specific ribonuclease subunit 3